MNKKYKIGIFGSSAGDVETAAEKAEALGNELSKYNVVVITGACPGLPYTVAYATAKKGVEVWGFSPEINLENQKKFTPETDSTIYKKLIYVPKNFSLVKNKMARKKYRNIISTVTCDAGIIISGRWGTMNEFTNLYDMGKVIGILTGTGGIADEMPKLAKKIVKKSKAIIIYDSSPENLIKKIIKTLKI